MKIIILNFGGICKTHMVESSKTSYYTFETAGGLVSVKKTWAEIEAQVLEAVKEAIPAAALVA